MTTTTFTSDVMIDLGTGPDEVKVQFPCWMEDQSGALFRVIGLVESDKTQCYADAWIKGSSGLAVSPDPLGTPFNFESMKPMAIDKSIVLKNKAL